jgi:hypothetical protein
MADAISLERITPQKINHFLNTLCLFHKPTTKLALAKNLQGKKPFSRISRKEA